MVLDDSAGLGASAPLGILTSMVGIVEPPAVTDDMEGRDG
jgi:hypothetical protein